MKKISEEHDKKTKQVAELMANLEHLRQSLSSSEVSHMIVWGIFHGWLVKSVLYYHPQEHLSTVDSLEGKLAQMKSELEHTRRSDSWQKKRRP